MSDQRLQTHQIGSAGDYAKFWPGADTVDIVGVDYYPHGDLSDLASHVQVSNVLRMYG